jgi:diguanylate cyclase (GGDEF)-like protein
MSSATIGFLVDEIVSAGNYQSSLWSAVSQAAVERGVSLITMVGGALNSETTNEFEYCRNDIYRLAADRTFDGLIIAGTIGSYRDPGDLAAFHQQFSVPTVEVGPLLEGVVCVSVDNYLAFRRLMDHLLSVHGCRRIAMIRGPKGGPEADARFQAYCDALAEAGIEPDPSLEFQGDFLPAGGARVVRSLSDEQLRSFDALVSANDNMALGALHELEARGISVPFDLRVTGFDDTDEAGVVSPALTTIRQPREQLARTALDTLLHRMEGEEVPTLVEIPAELIIRRSCGCLQAAGFTQARTVPAESVQDSDEDTVIDAEVVLKEVETVLGPSAEHHLVETQRLRRIISAFTAGTSAAMLQEGFVREMDSLNEHLLHHSDDAQYAHRVVAAVQKAVFPRVVDGARLRRASEMIHQAVAKIGEANLNWVINERLTLERTSAQLHDASRSLLSQFDMSSLLDSIQRNLPQFGIDECYILLRCSLFDEDTSEDAHYLMRAFRDAETIDVDLREHSYSDILSMVTDQDTGLNHIAESLYFREQVFGYIVIGCRSEHRVVVESLITHICGALNAWKLFKAQEESRMQLQQSLAEREEMNRRLKELSITDSLTGLYNRRGLVTVGKQQLLVSRRKRERALILYIDMDHLKRINDEFGHDAGDRAIIGMAERLRRTLRDSDIVARLGGDEFTAIALDTNAGMANTIEQKIRESVSEWNDPGGHPISIECTIGFAEFNPEDPTELETLLTAADRDLLSKRGKRSR